MLLTIFSNAKATLIGVDDLQWGGSSVTLDTTTGLEWLDITKTYGVWPYAQLLDNLSPGYKYEGWHIASSEQVLTLLGEAGLPSDASGFNDTSGKYTDAMTSFQNLIGAYTTSNPDNLYTWGVVNDLQSSGSISRIWLNQLIRYDYSTGEGVPSHEENYSNGVESMTIDDFNNINKRCTDPIGAWLVRPARELYPAPEPTTMVLFGIGIVGLIGGGRIKRKK